MNGKENILFRYTIATFTVSDFLLFGTLGVLVMIFHAFFFMKTTVETDRRDLVDEDSEESEEEDGN